MNEFTLIFEYLFSSLVFLSLRLFSVQKLKNTGCDAFNIILNIEEFKKQKKLPVDVGNIFMLENKTQWYPPIYLIVLSIFNLNFIKKHHWILNHLIDLVSLFIFLTICDLFEFGFEKKILIALLYGTSVCLLNEFYSLNVRPIGLAIYNLSLFFLILYEVHQIYYFIWIPGVILFYAHKFSFQCLILTFFVFSLFLKINYMIYLLLIILTSFIIWPTGFKELVKSHLNILSFWNKNWSNLGSHIINESKFYNDGITKNAFFDLKENTEIFKYLKKLLSYNFFIIPYIIILINYDQNLYGDKLIILINSIYLFSIATHWIKKFRFLGLGFQYIKYSFLPVICFIFLNIENFTNFLFLSVLLLSSFFHLRSYFYFYKQTVPTQASKKIDSELIQFIKKKNIDKIMILPTYNADKIAYLTKKRVYWGTHADVFDDRLNKFFPVLKEKLSYYKKDGVNYLLLDKNYVNPKNIGLTLKKEVFSINNYKLFKL